MPAALLLRPWLASSRKNELAVGVKPLSDSTNVPSVLVFPVTTVMLSASPIRVSVALLEA
ncbi:hypothetical protein D3C87_1893740 [compost metagenome]